ncbi:hypothetical protein D8674_015525 [Pyrus ussuriensis x Pyrus communis]|uniref:Uncharacterized protein n=1 Tax=Pyrus ussuriensis x Pyrus communis TaxID=2448454 RepID=A0A5N5GVL7_9ROSA|nr:hypothetical protein D8674_015525 [Pyrus ussuriensis x Pyrus communis]
METSNETAPNDIENQYTPLANSMRKEFTTLSPMSSSCCIYRVPERIRCVNEKLYTPQAVSIAPLHHGRKGLNPILDEHKQRYLKDFMDRTKVSLEDHIKTIKDQEERLRCCYAEPIKYSSDEFVRIILVDAAFTIEVLLKDRYHEFVDENDRIFNKPRMLQDIWKDMWLIENQLPLFILEDLFEACKTSLPSSSHNITSIISLSFEFFKHLLPVKKLDDNMETYKSVAHFVDLFKRVFEILLPSERKAGGKLKSLNIPSLTELHQVGVRFKARPAENIFGIEFSTSNGTLTIPRIALGLETEIIRNVLAFEQCHFSNNANDTLYMKLLVEYQIAKVAKWLVSDTSEGSAPLNSISTGVNPNAYNFYYDTICEDLNKYCSKPWHKWKANLKQNYFNTPWASISVIAAVVLLILTLVQTVFSIISVT